FLPPGTVWQLLQLPISANWRPCLISAGSKLCGLGGSIAAIAGRQAMANAIPAPPTSSAANMPPMMPFLVIRTSGFFRFLAQRAASQNCAHFLLIFRSAATAFCRNTARAIGVPLPIGRGMDMVREAPAQPPPPPEAYPAEKARGGVII